MAKTPIRLPVALTERVARAAERAGMTSDAFILDAIVESVDEAERRSGFRVIAEERYANIIASGETIPWSDMRTYLEGWLAGRTPSRPVAR